MLKRSRVLVLSFIALFIFLKLNCPVKGQEHALSMTVYCPTEAYVGESFFCQVNIYSNDTISHEYALLWIIDNPGNLTPTFKTSGTIGPNETINTGSSFTFSDARDTYLSLFTGGNAHLITLALVEDGYILTTEDHLVSLIDVDVSLFALGIKPTPIYPDSSFSLDVAVTNEGDETINATVIAYGTPGMHDKIILQSGTTANLGSIVRNALKNTTFNFEVRYDTPAGVYPIKLQVKFYDARAKLYTKNYVVPITISPTDRLDIVEPELRQEIDKLKGDLDTAYKNITVIGIAVLAVSIGMGLANYWYTRRIGSTRKRVVTEKSK